MNNRPKVYPAELVEAVRNLYVDEGMGMQSVATRLGINRIVVERVLRNHNIETRGRTERGVPSDRVATGFRNDLAYCRDLDRAIFFSERPTGKRYAADICRSHCLVMEGCLRYATTVGEEFGVWGGCTEAQRETLAKKWDGSRQLVAECHDCERSFVPLIEGTGDCCPFCRETADVQHTA